MVRNNIISKNDHANKEIGRLFLQRNRAGPWEQSSLDIPKPQIRGTSLNFAARTKPFLYAPRNRERDYARRSRQVPEDSEVAFKQIRQ
ncbi:unnamed protein product [Linum trigynum]|uniref:Uncharacterized protein n=1 Tax=Linum trigynum TaxID=586398 RepID=A0AAV2ESE1_9ROSI